MNNPTERRSASGQAPECPLGEPGCPFPAEVARLRSDLSTLAQEVRTDALTGLYNFRHLSELLEQEVERSRRSGLPLALLMVDLDHFKQLNDRCGHETGNKALVQVARVLRQGVRRIDSACRYGGEEMTLVLPATHLPRAVEVADRLRRRIDGLRLDSADGPVRVSASFGVAVFPGAGVDDAAALVQVADGMLYRAKELGRNRVCHPPLIAETPKAQVTSDEKEALLK